MRAAPSVASACSASGRTFDGPHPKRPSRGSRSAGMVMLIDGSSRGAAACDQDAAGAWLMALVATLSQPSTSSGLRGSGPM